MIKRLTPEHGWNNACYDTWEICGLDYVCKRDCWEPVPCKIPKMLYRLAAYEDTGLSLEEVQELAKAKADGRLVVLPCKVGDKIFSFRWNIKNEKHEVYSGEVKNVRCNSSDGLVMVSDGEMYRVLGKTVFLTREEAEKALEGSEC